MGSKGQIPPPPPYMRGPHPSLGMALAEPFGGPAIRPPQGSFPVFDMLPPPEIVEQKLAAQHIEMDSLATENQRLAATHGTLRQQLAAAQQDLNILEAQAEAVKSEKEQQRRGLFGWKVPCLCGRWWPLQSVGYDLIKSCSSFSKVVAAFLPSWRGRGKGSRARGRHRS
ncbi:hypothetical protein Dimus_015593 [Dionaea muscipula]